MGNEKFPLQPPTVEHIASLNWRRIQYMYIFNKFPIFLIGSRKKGSCQYLLLVCQPLLSIGSYILLFVTKDASSKRVQHSVWSNQASCQKFTHKNKNIKINTTDCIFFLFYPWKKKHVLLIVFDSSWMYSLSKHLKITS